MNFQMNSDIQRSNTLLQSSLGGYIYYSLSDYFELLFLKNTTIYYRNCGVDGDSEIAQISSLSFVYDITLFLNFNN